MCKMGDSVLINYFKLLENIDEQIGNDKILKEVLQSEINEMKEYDKINGSIRRITKISYRDYLGKKIPKYELDNQFCYYDDELKAK